MADTTNQQQVPTTNVYSANQNTVSSTTESSNQQSVPEFYDPNQQNTMGQTWDNLTQQPAGITNPCRIPTHTSATDPYVPPTTGQQQTWEQNQQNAYGNYKAYDYNPLPGSGNITSIFLRGVHCELYLNRQNNHIKSSSYMDILIN